ncbi:DNA-directed RNA polymerase I subunit 1-like isoform X2 [Impatiens glandulifera]|uniref:DNA-directed RNA polymerase I subunit 1-like isoform X2 n=1 Tax=Impatiens glandulifera TaxID=253017 RepID=UPI001FB0BD96|nr:DNA-directed RNA polymerase I subunit 1-like isoform X2 [Impatiens glandulifera]
MAQSDKDASEMVESVQFSFMTDEEVRKHSVVKITNPILLDSMDKPVPGGLYDPYMGPLDEQTPCKSCGQRYFHCPGHCGHIDLVTPVFNPLMFGMLYNILQMTCFYCLHFRESRNQVNKCTAQLELIAKGDIAGAKSLQSSSLDTEMLPEDSDMSHISSSTVHSSEETCYSDHGRQGWTSLQFTEAMSILYTFLKIKTPNCKNCEAINLKITRPSFGWIELIDLDVSHFSSNMVRGLSVNELYGESEENSSSEVLDGESSISKGAISQKQQRKGDNTVDEIINEKKFSGPLLPYKAREILKRLWENEAPFCSFICNIQHNKHHNDSANVSNYSMFFLESVLVPPTKFRPPAKGGDSVMEHPQTVLMEKVLQSNIGLANSYANSADRSRTIDRLRELQQSMNVLYDSKASTGKDAASGICQLLEKKEGIFRQKMMGKRVNYACRSVISPDPYLAVNEIGIPPYFALRLTYPERLTPWNATNLRNAIINGPEIHPGATHYVDKMSTVKLPVNKKARVAISRKLPSSRGVVSLFSKSSEGDSEGKTVYRHLRDGDIVLVNRQPTLHKPSIMAHVVRVLKGEKTLRMHYANCSSYNADFDGDEMNVHLPQDDISRSEAYNIVNANEQYIVPTRGDTVRGLIQDHIVSGVILAMKDSFLTREQFNHLLYSSGIFTASSGSLYSNQVKKISLLIEANLPPILPAILKPKPLWTGKQVISAVLNYLTRDYPPFTVEKEGKIPSSYFRDEPTKNVLDMKEEKGEHVLLIWKNQLVRGVIDKAQFGKYGLVHTVQELYGSNIAGSLLSAFSRLFTVFLQFHGFTCGLDDLMILPKADGERNKFLEDGEAGEMVHCKFLNVIQGTIGSSKLQLEIEKAIHNNGQAAVTLLDLRMKNELNDTVSTINKKLLTKGVLKTFPKNCISLMTISGAKGSTVNFQQISSCLGQQELEGKRVPKMVSGKTLPCFPPWDFTSRSGGFIGDRFLTGLRPQEYYFHCMAGREGLVDTAVKTSRSGYLQRCLVKNMESLKVCYDYTVRDADGSVIQFTYGGDGVDVHKTGFITEFKALTQNQEIISQKYRDHLDFNSYITGLPEILAKKANKYIEKLNEVEKTATNKKQLKRLLKLVRQKYISSLAHAGEPVGVIAAQSVGEPSTQMTLNTFHHAGRGEMNVTLGIPRLQEILMTGSNEIKTPIMTCPFLEGKLSSRVNEIVKEVRKITVADVIESIEVSVLPVFQKDQHTCVYKLMLKFSKDEEDLLEESKDILENMYVRELEDAIQHHMILLSRLSGIKNAKIEPSSSDFSAETDEDGSKTKSSKGVEDDDDDEVDDEEQADDLGLTEKTRPQATDEMDYDDDGSDHDINKTETSEMDEREKEVEDDEEDSKMKKKNPDPTESIEKEKAQVKRPRSKKEPDRSIFVAAEGLVLEVHFSFTDEPHILLAQIAQKVAKKICLRNSGKIETCHSVKFSREGRDQVIWPPEVDDVAVSHETNDSDENNDPGPWGLKMAGIDFSALWEMQDDLDVNRIYSNNIYNMLTTYGVEAARETIIREVNNVFSSYGVEIDPRHISLISDFMTYTGSYRSMSRHGAISDSTSPFLKMTFETASKFIVEASSHSMIDTMETPSARICLGLPVKMGTGSFHLLQKMDY